MEKNPFESINHKLDAINQRLNLIATPELKEEPQKPLTFKEACSYVNLSESYMRLLCHKGEIPFHRPQGRRRLQFIREELNEWMVNGGTNTRAFPSQALARTYL